MEGQERRTTSQVQIDWVEKKKETEERGKQK